MRLLTLCALALLAAACPTSIDPADAGEPGLTGGGSSAGGAPGGGSGAGGATGGGAAGGMGGGSAAVDAGPSAPDTRLTQQPMGVVGPMAPVTFGFDCDVGPCTFECAWDTEAFTACTSPSTRQGFTDGRHDFRVRALRDGLVDASPASARFEVDAVPPVVTFSSTPMNGQPTSRPVDFSTACDSTPCTLECSLDGAPFATCPQPLRLEVGTVGSHTLRVRGTDAAGNVGAAAMHAFTLVFGWRSVAVANATVCAVAGDRTLHCWGGDSSGTLGQGAPPATDGGGEGGGRASPRPLRVGTDSDWDSVHSAERFFCASKTSGATSCWGSNQNGLFGDPAVTQPATFAPTPVAHRFTIFGGSSASACGLDATGALFCWGDGENGVLGDGLLTPHVVATPLRVGTDTWRSVAVGDHVCAVRTDGSLWCFGDNNSGELGLDPMTTPAIAAPSRVGTDTDWAEVDVGSEFTCARKQSGEVFCFGTAANGVLGSGATTDTTTPTRVGSATYRSLSVTTFGACAVTPSNVARCWGQNEAGELGARVPFTATPTPIDVETTTPLWRVIGRRRLRCALTTTDGLECWGDNVSANGGLGRGVTGGQATPLALDGPWSALAVSNAGGCGVSDGGLSCWGRGVHLALADAGVVLPTPMPVSTATGWTAVALTGTATPLLGPQSLNPSPFGHACGLRSGGQLFCWGRNTFGQLGVGTTTPSFTPVAVPPPSGATWSQVAVSEFNTCAIASTGRLYCWGNNMLGQVGVGMASSVAVTSPTAIASPATDWTFVAVHQMRVLARRGNGTLWTWGGGVATPTAVDAATDWEEGQWVSNSWCARKTNGTVSCRLGTQAPAAVVGLTDAVRLARSQNQLCALRASGSISCVNNNGTNWVIVSTLTPAMPLRSWEMATGLACGLGMDDRRWCTGTRARAQLGDGFDERVPAPALTP